MANEIQPPTPVTNVASLVNPNTLSTLNSTTPPKAFGDQTKDQATQKIITADTHTSLTKLEKEKALLIKEGIQLDIDHQKALFNLDVQHKKYQTLQSGDKTNTSNQTTPSQLTQSVITAGKPPYKYKASGYGKNQVEIKIYDSSNNIVVDYILDPPNTSFSAIQQSSDDIISQLKESGDQSEILNDKKYLVHIYGVPEDQKPEPPSTGLSDEEYQKAVINENKNYEEAKKDLQSRKDKNQKAIDDFKKDIRKKQKDAKKKRKDKRAKRQKRTKEEKRKARKAKVNAILKNGKKTLVPILTLLLSNKIADVIAQNDKIQKLVDDTNALITEANDSGDSTKLKNAQLARDNAIKVINDNEDKIRRIRDQINKISIYVTIFSVIVTIVSSIPLPTSVPPGIGIPVSLIVKFIKILDKANRILLALSALLPILLTILEKAISILEDLKSQLLNLNGQIESDSAANGDNQPYNGSPNFGTVSETYKGFRFAIREDMSFGGVHVGPYKRHYAVAIDKWDVEVLKSELSFTLDPNDLIDQLKLVIDSQGLITGDGLSSSNGDSNSANSGNPTNSNNSQLDVSDVPSSSIISSLKQAAKKPPPPLKIIAPAGGTTANIPLGVVEKAKIVAAAAASGPNPAPKLDAAFIFAADKKWHDEDKAYKNSVNSNTNVKI